VKGACHTAVWLVRAGKYGEQKQAALDRNIATIGWGELPDLAPVADKEALEALYQQRYPTSPP
jgi:restriction system protein